MQWLVNTPCYWNVFNHEIRTNNALEGWHSHVNDKCNNRHLNIRRFIFFIQNEEMNQRGDLAILARGENLSQRNCKYRRIDKNIATLKSRYVNCIITKEEYLEGIARNLAGSK